MKKFFLYALMVSLMFIFASCSGLKSKANSLASKLVEAQVDGDSWKAKEAERELKAWIGDLSDDDRSEAIDLVEESLTESYMKAFDKELSDIADAIKNHYYSSSLSSPYKDMYRKIDKLDKDYKRYASRSLSKYLGQAFSKELEETANAVLKGVKDQNSYDIKAADKDLVKDINKISDKVSAIGGAYEDAYKDVLEKKFYEYLEDYSSEYEDIAKSGDKKKVEKFLSDKEKEFKKIFKSASEDVNSAFGSAYTKFINEILKQDENN